MKQQEIQERLRQHGLKATPQRILILQIILDMRNHPTAEMVISKVIRKQSTLSPGTVYKTLEAFVKKGIINRIMTEKDIMRYDPVTERHHHLYINNTKEILDYRDEELNRILEDYFRKKKIPGFRVKDFHVEIKGEKTDY